MKKYAEIPRNDVDHRAENAWFMACQENKVPFITVKVRTKLADVHWDYIAYPTEVDEFLDGLGNQLRESAISIYTKYADSRSECNASDKLVWFRNLEIYKARLAAEELYDLIDGLVACCRKNNLA